MTKDEFVGEMIAYFTSTRKISEEESSLIVQSWEEQFPHAGTADLIFWPFKEMNYDEIAEEVFVREALWNNGGDKAVRERIREQAKEALASSDTPKFGRKSAQLFLNSDRDAH